MYIKNYNRKLLFISSKAIQVIEYKMSILKNYANSYYYYLSNNFITFGLFKPKIHFMLERTVQIDRNSW